MECKKCNTKLVEGALYCHNCGSKVQASCRSCGRELIEVANFCPFCGTRVSEASATVELDNLEALILDLLEDKLEGEFEEVEDLIDDEGWELIEESEEAEDDFVHLIFDEDEDGKTFGEILPSFFAKSEMEDKDKEAFEEDELEEDDIW